MIEVEGISKTYGQNKALTEVSFSVEKGEIVGLVGRNGAGKSTTMNIISGYLSSDTGTVRINGHSITEEPVKAKEQLGYMPEFPPLYPEMTVESYLKFVCELMGVGKEAIKEELERVMQKADLLPVRKRLIGNLSKGYKQRVGIAKALCGDPENIILDEPTSGLDPQQIVEIRKVIRSLRKDHAVIISSHILKELADTCTRFIIIERGQIAADSTLEELTRKSGEGAVLELAVKDGDIDEGILSQIPGIVSVTKLPTRDGAKRFELHEESGSDKSEEVSRTVTEHGGLITVLSHKERSLEDAFLDLTERSGKENA